MRQFTGGLLLISIVAGCKTATPVVQQATPKPVILTLGSKDFTTDDFFQSFTKNQLSADSTQHTDINGYFDLYTNLKLKVLAAEAEGRDTTESFREEMTTYRKQLAQSYLSDKVLVESLAAEAYQRMQEDVDVSHILLPVAEDALPSDTLTAYQTALSLRKQVLAGSDFAQLARQYSKDLATAQKGGELGYVTAFQLVYPLETAAYNTPVGIISEPVRTRFGYHLLKVNSKRPSRGRVRVAHLFMRVSPDADEAGQKAAQARINAAYDRLQKGEAFDTVVRETSDDATSKTNGGVLPPFEPGRWVAAFEDASFALAKPGDYSKPVQTNYGWHIIRLIERKNMEPYTVMAPVLRQRVTTDTRADVIRQATLQRLRKLYPVQEMKSVLDQAVAKTDSSLLRGQWHYTEPLAPTLQNKTLVTIAARPFTVNQFFEYVQQRQQPRRNPALTQSATPTEKLPSRGSSPIGAMQRLFDRFVGDQLMDQEEADLEKKSPEFRALIAEIHDGVLLSDEMEQHVWERSMADSTGQKNYFEQHKIEYVFPERAIATLVVAQNDNVLKQVTTMLAGKSPYQLRRSASALAFDEENTTLTPALRESLFDVLVVMMRNQDYLVEVSGSHDPTERDSVSAGRIRSVVDYLQKNGIPLGRIMEKDYQGTRPGAVKEAQRNVTFQYFSTAKPDIAKAITSQSVGTDESPAVVISEGSFAKGENTYVDRISPWKQGTTVLHQNGKAIAVQIDRIEPARPKTFTEARGAVINDYQAVLEKEWLDKLRQKYPVKVNQEEIRRLAR